MFLLTVFIIRIQLPLCSPCNHSMPILYMTLRTLLSFYCLQKTAVIIRSWGQYKSSRFDPFTFGQRAPSSRGARVCCKASLDAEQRDGPVPAGSNPQFLVHRAHIPVTILTSDCLLKQDSYVLVTLYPVHFCYSSLSLSIYIYTHARTHTHTHTHTYQLMH